MIINTTTIFYSKNKKQKKNSHLLYFFKSRQRKKKERKKGSALRIKIKNKTNQLAPRIILFRSVFSDWKKRKKRKKKEKNGKTFGENPSASWSIIQWIFSYFETLKYLGCFMETFIVKIHHWQKTQSSRFVSFLYLVRITNPISLLK